MSAKKFFPAAAALIGSLAVAACGAEPDRWRPGPDLTWQVQLSGGLDARVVADVYDVDGVDTPDGELAAAADRGAHLVCYFSAGTVENWRADADGFPDAHEPGLAVGQKNAVELVDEHDGDVDFAVNEGCFAYDECDAYRPLLPAGKAVVVTE